MYFTCFKLVGDLVKWDSAWHGQENREIDDVNDAIIIRDDPTLKTGDLYCCEEECERLSPVKRKKLQSRHFRRLSGARKKKSKKEVCKEIRRSNEKGESWKHSRVVLQIVKFLNNEGKEEFAVESTEIIAEKDEPDIKVQHSEILPGFESNTTYVVVPHQNLRRAKAVFEGFEPNCIAVEIHRWRDADVDFQNYINERVRRSYDRSGGRRNPAFLHRRTSVPNLGIWDESVGGQQRFFTIDPSSDQEETKGILEWIGELQDAVERHNEWAVETPGKLKFHLRNLKFQSFGLEWDMSKHPHNDGRFEDPCIQAMYLELRMLHQKSYSRTGPAITMVRSGRKIRWGQAEMALFVNSAGEANAEDVWENWGDLSESRKLRAFRNVKRSYRRATFWRGGPFGGMLTDLEMGKTPNILVDTTGIEEEILSNQDSKEDAGVLDIDSYRVLKYLITADRREVFPNRKDPSFIELISSVRIFSSDLTKKVTLEIPNRILDRINKSGNIERDIVAALENSSNQEEE